MFAVSLRSVLSFVPTVRAGSSTGRPGMSRNLFDALFGTTTTNTNSPYPIVADESVMSKKAHGTSEKPVQKNLRWNCDYDTADRIWCVFS
jgi:hypothetical protein